MKNLAFKNCKMTNMGMGCCVNYRQNELRRTIDINNYDAVKEMLPQTEAYVGQGFGYFETLQQKNTMENF